MTKRAGLGQEKRRALHIFFFSFLCRSCGKNKAIRTNIVSRAGWDGHEGFFFWGGGSFGANLKCTVKQLANGQLGLDYKGKFTYSTRAL